MSKKDFDSERDLTPTQNLIMNNLAARHRLGHTMWPFSTKLRKHLSALEDHGLIGTKSGIMPRTIEIWLTSFGKERYLSPTYVAPIMGELTAKAESKVLNAHGAWCRSEGGKATDPIESDQYFHAALIAEDRARSIKKAFRR